MASKQKGGLGGNLDFLIKTKDLAMASDKPRVALANTHELEKFWLKLQLLSFSFLICKTEARQRIGRMWKAESTQRMIKIFKHEVQQSAHT